MKVGDLVQKNQQVLRRGVVLEKEVRGNKSLPPWKANRWMVAWDDGRIEPCFELDMKVINER
ncbi:hypothetical protein CMI47_14440 [Candidatus Pacearchaeota archaeon]|nr:hypothetical protein [Candidatus Pacearchaeota archaeon]